MRQSLTPLIIRLNALTFHGRGRNRDARRASLRGGQYPAYLGGTLTAWAYGLDPHAATITGPDAVGAFILNQG